ncbi:MAG: hypothetical protein IPP32_00005 [Bacteroidetes bacterium]|nr:hypothetical protein [Bacteroidota bacterium]
MKKKLTQVIFGLLIQLIASTCLFAQSDSITHFLNKSGMQSNLLFPVFDSVFDGHYNGNDNRPTKNFTHFQFWVIY